MTEILIGIISGIVSGTGMGGGTILIFLLTFALGIAIIVNIRNKNINLKLATTISVFGILGAIIGANLSIHTDVNMLRKCFGIFLALIAIHEIYTMIKENKKVKIRDNK